MERGTWEQTANFQKSPFFLFLIPYLYCLRLHWHLWLWILAGSSLLRISILSLAIREKTTYSSIILVVTLSATLTVFHQKCISLRHRKQMALQRNFQLLQSVPLSFPHGFFIFMLQLQLQEINTFAAQQIYLGDFSLIVSVEAKTIYITKVIRNIVSCQETYLVESISDLSFVSSMNKNQNTVKIK